MIKATHWVEVICACALALSLASGASAQEVYQRVFVDLNGGVFKTALPFREPFVMVGVAPVSLREVRARYRQTGGLVDRATACDTTVHRNWERPAPEPWFRSSDADSFYVAVPELDANTRYLFCVTGRSVLTGVSLAAFQVDAAAEIDRQLRELERVPGGLPRVLPAAQMRQIQLGLLAAIERRTNRTVTTRSGSVFDTSTTGSSTDILPSLNQVIEKQIQRSQSLETLEKQFDGAESAEFLGGLDNHPTLSKIVGKLDPGQAVPRLSAAAVARAVATAGVLLKPRSTAIALTARGEMPLDPTAIGLTNPAPLAILWSPDPLATRIANLEESSRRIAELQSVVESIPASPALQGKLEITPAEATELTERLEMSATALQLIRSTFAQLADALTLRQVFIENTAAGLGSAAEREVTLEGTSILEFQSRAKSYVGADIGLVAAPWIDEVAPYFGANFYCGAVNKRVPLRYAGRFCDRFAILIGLTGQSFAEEGEREDLFSSYSLLVGGGFRITDALRLSGGAAFLRNISGDSDSPSTPVTATPFLSLSFDIDARSALGRVGDVLSK